VGFSRDGKQISWGKTYNYQNINQDGKLEYHLRLPTSDRPLGSPKQINPNQNYLRAKDKWQDWSLHSRSGKWGKNAILDIKNQNRTIASIERGSSDDQTVRLWNVTTRENLLTLFHGSNGEWLVWTNSGHYTSSPNGDKMIGWQINKGADKAADYVTATQLAQHFYRPDIINTTIKLGSAKRAVAQAENTGFNLNILTVLSATDADSVSLEIKRLQHGVFTYALLQGLKGEADMVHKHKKQITFKELDTYVSLYVEEETKYRQKTISQAGSGGFKNFIFMQL